MNDGCMHVKHVLVMNNVLRISRIGEGSGRIIRVPLSHVSLYVTYIYTPIRHVSAYTSRVSLYVTCFIRSGAFLHSRSALITNLSLCML
jgi:hypothetical protein